MLILTWICGWKGNYKQPFDRYVPLLSRLSDIITEFLQCVTNSFFVDRYQIIKSGIEDGLQYLGKYPGLWNLLGRMLDPKPKRRISSSDALKVTTEILYKKGSSIEERSRRDGSYFNYVIEDLEICTIPEFPTETVDQVSDISSVSPRPLHFVATFDRSEPLGLILAEADAGDDDGEYQHGEAWKKAISGSKDGDVFIRDIIPGGQAERIGVFEIGDHLAGVGEFPHPNANAKGFEGFLNMLNAVPER
jgi:serine/threonine protein kinase